MNIRLTLASVLVSMVSVLSAFGGDYVLTFRGSPKGCVTVPMDADSAVQATKEYVVGQGIMKEEDFISTWKVVRYVAKESSSGSGAMITTGFIVRIGVVREGKKPYSTSVWYRYGNPIPNNEASFVKYADGNIYDEENGEEIVGWGTLSIVDERGCPIYDPSGIKPPSDKTVTIGKPIFDPRRK